MSNGDLLRSVPLFSGLSEQYLFAIERLARHRSYAPGEPIICEGEEGVGLYVIVEGLVDVAQHTKSGELDLGHMGPGDVFGELALLTHRPRLATVRAIEPTTCLIILALTFEKMLDHSPEVAKTLCKTLARWLEEAEDRVRGT
jgi:CRP-like cAMP-binding protein